MSNDPVTAAIKTIEQSIGFPSGTKTSKGIYPNSELEILPSQRDLVMQWALLNRITRKTLAKSSNLTLGKLYHIPSYLAAVQKNDRGGKPYKYETPLNLEPLNPTLNPPLNPVNSIDLEDETGGEAPAPAPVEPIGIDNTKFLILQRDLISIDNRLGIIEEKVPHIREEIIDAVARKFEANDKASEEKINHVLTSHKSLIEASAKKLAVEAAHDIINKSLPRKLTIITKDKEITLGAEPRHKIFDEALSWLLSGEHIYLVGPAGTGKTHLGKQLATALELPFLPMPQALTKYELSGYLDGSGIYRGTIFRQAVEHGGLLVMDEIDINGASAVAFANSVMANGYCAFPDKTIEAHPNLKIMACANTFGRGATQDYVGRNPLDAATLDRFAYLEADYDEDMERMLFGNTPWVQYIHQVRKATETLKLRHIVSMRSIARGQRGLDLNLPLEKVMFSSLWRGLDKDTINKIENMAGKFQATITPTPTPTSITPSIDNAHELYNSLYMPTKLAVKEEELAY